MILYNCACCNYSSKIKCNWIRHLKSKKHFTNNEISLSVMVKSPNEPKMSQKEPEKSQKEPPFFCEFCDLNFITYSNKRRHELHRCKENSSIKDKKINKLEKDKKKLEKKIEKMMDKMCTINNTTNNTQNIVIVNNYGKENTDYLTVDKIKKLLDRPYDSIQDLIKMLHFNADHPENHNVKITNKKEQFALVWNDPIWELRKKKSLVKDMVDKGYMMIDTTHDEVSYDTNKTNKKYLKFQNNYEDDATNIKDKIEEETEIVIFNESKKHD
jgi:DNA-binding protein YbaB